jgi:menaquinone-dependent protoporphyrinogen oxidase
MRILIVYASRHGQTRKITQRIADVAEAEGAEVHLFEVSEVPREVLPHSCDLVILAGALYFGRHQKKLERFASAQRTNLAKVRTAFVSVSGAARTAEGRPVAVEAAQSFVTRTGWTPDRIELVAGGEPYTRYGFFTRHFMIRYSRKLGRIVDPKCDYEFTDWEQVDRFARELIAAAGVPAVRHAPANRAVV